MTEEDEIYEAFDHANKFKAGELTGQKIIEAVQANNAEEVKRLMNLNADDGGLIILRLTQKDRNGKSAIQIAEENNNHQIIEILRGKRK
jgi:ketosteroid isomerase-like protein